MASKLFSLCFILLALVCAARAQDGGGRPTLHGVVVDEKGAPIQGALVRMLGVGVDGAGTTNTDAEGRFEFADASPRGFELSVSAEGFGRVGRVWKAGEWDGGEVRLVLRPQSYIERVSVTAARSETRLAETAASVGSTRRTSPPTGSPCFQTRSARPKPAAVAEREKPAGGK